jgi:hypothetical protein
MESGSGRKEACSFLKKRTKKLFRPGARASGESLFASFSSEKEESLP